MDAEKRVKGSKGPVFPGRRRNLGSHGRILKRNGGWLCSIPDWVIPI